MAKKLKSLTQKMNRPVRSNDADSLSMYPLTLEQALRAAMATGKPPKLSRPKKGQRRAVKKV
jgi:hypothetical protein